MDLSSWLFTALVGAVGLERLAELRVANRNVRWMLDRGGREYGGGHYPVMVILHIGLLVGCLAEVWLGGFVFVPWLGWPFLALVLASQVLRWWCIASLGRRWSTRVVVLPGAPLVTDGPYRWFRHPNYVAVVVEGAALPLVGSAWLTAVLFTIANAALLRVRLRCENTALVSATSESAARVAAGAPVEEPG